MSNRNETLVDIVEALGGTVRNPSVQNMLLEDWLQAIGGSRSDFYLQFNGVDSYGSFTPIPVSAGDSISIVFSKAGAIGAFTPLFDSSTGSPRVAARVASDGLTWNFIGLTGVEIDGLAVSAGDPLPADTDTHILTAEITTTADIAFIATNFAMSVFWAGVGANLTIVAGGVTKMDCYIDDSSSNTQENSGDPANPITLFNVDPSDWVEGPL